MRRANLAVAIVVGACLLCLTAPAARAQSTGTLRPVKKALGETTLNRPVAQLKLSATRLEDALTFLRDTTDANIHVNWKALETAGISRDGQVTVDLRRVPLRKALNYVLAGQGPVTWYLDEGVIEVTTQELADKHVYTRVYTVEDLIMEVPDFYGPQFSLQNAGQQSQGGGGGQSLFQGQQQQQQQQQQPGNSTRDRRGRELADLVVQTIRPDVWRQNGGAASIAYFNGMLVVTAPRQVHEMIAGR